MNTIVIGDGAWGTAFAMVLADSKHTVKLFSFFPEYAEEIKEKKENYKYLPGVTIPDNIQIVNIKNFTNFEEADLIINAVPTQFVRNSFEKIKNYIKKDTPIISLSKGLEIKTEKRISQVLNELFPQNDIFVLSGPSHAEEVSKKLPTAVTLAGENKKILEDLRDEISNKYFRIYTNEDLIGVELGGALKNVIALAAGMIDGLGFGDNTKSALITRGIVEMIRLAEKEGANFKTFYGLSGLGDLITTSISQHGRNWNCGYQIGKGKSLNEILNNTNKVIEGVFTVKVTKKLCTKYNIEMPIAEKVYEVLYKNKKPYDAVIELMTRKLKFE